MEFSSTNLDIKSDPEFGVNCLHFTFKGKFTEAASESGTRAWSEEFDKNPDMHFSLLWDCTDMSGFEPSARKEWYRCMKIYKARISEVTIIASSIIIRGAAKVMMEFFGIKCRVIRSKDELLAEAY